MSEGRSDRENDAALWDQLDRGDATAGDYSQPLQRAETLISAPVKIDERRSRRLSARLLVSLLARFKRLKTNERLGPIRKYDAYFRP